MGKATNRVTISDWASNRLDIPIIAVNGRNHCSLIGDPEDEMVDYIVDFLKVGDAGGKTYDDWLAGACQYGAKGLQKMLINPGAGAASITGEAKALLDHFVGRHIGTQMEGWQQFVVHARDERGDGVSDFMIEVLTQQGDSWPAFEDMYVDVHPYGPDPSFRCFHIRLPTGILAGTIPLKVRIHATTGTILMAYQGYGDTVEELTVSQPVELNLAGLNKPGSSLFHPFTTTLIEIILNREPLPFNELSPIFQIVDRQPLIV